jgi:hypothetical protein
MVSLLLRMLNQKTMMSFQKSMKDTGCGSLCLDLYEPYKCLAPLRWARKRSWGLNFTALWEGLQMLGKLVGSAFQPSPPFLARFPHDEERIVVRGRKLVLRANAKKVFLTNRPLRWLALSSCLRRI